MCVLKKHNRSGSTSVVVVSKASGKYKEIKSFGSSTSEEEIDSLCDKAAAWIRSFGGQQELDFEDRKGKEVEESERFLSYIDNVLINGTKLLLDQIYDSIGFNKFLEISKDIEVVISEEKIAGDCKWDRLKGYITNTDLDADRVIAEYHGLWTVERAFRISKGTLEMRPMFHFTERRIEAHVCICFMAYKIYKELERLIVINKTGLSVDKVLEAAKTIKTIRVRMPENGTYFTKTLFLTEKHLAIKSLFDLSGNKS